MGDWDEYREDPWLGYIALGVAIAIAGGVSPGPGVLLGTGIWVAFYGFLYRLGMYEWPSTARMAVGTIGFGLAMWFMISVLGSVGAAVVFACGYSALVFAANIARRTFALA